MKIVIGTKNRAKIEAMQEIIAAFPCLENATLESASVTSGISDQPMTMEETILGAKTRAENAFSKDVTYSLGVESGLAEVPSAPSGYICFCFCSIFDGTCHYLGSSTGFEVPPKILSYILEGMDMSQACVASGITKNALIGQDEGLIGILTSGRVDRKEYSKQAIASAMMQLEHASWYPSSLFNLNS